MQVCVVQICGCKYRVARKYVWVQVSVGMGCDYMDASVWVQVGWGVNMWMQVRGCKYRVGCKPIIT